MRVFFTNQRENMIAGVILIIAGVIIENAGAVLNHAGLVFSLSNIFVLCTFIAGLIVLNIISQIKIKELRTEIIDLKECPNENVKKFKLGDEVMRKSDKDSKNPTLYVVTKITKNEVGCFDANNQEVKLPPEVLFTNSETATRIAFLKEERQRLQREQDEYAAEIRRTLEW